MIMKYLLATIVLVSACLLCPPHTELAAQEAAEATMPAEAEKTLWPTPKQKQPPETANAEEYASVARISSAANIRSAASLSSEILRAVPPGYPLAILERRGDWVLVEDFMARKGWVYASLLAEPGTVIIKVWKGNLRTGPGLTDGIITKLEHGTMLSVAGTRGDWLQVSDAAGKSGWLHRDVAWPPRMTTDPTQDAAVVSETLPGQRVKEINPGMIKKKTAEPAMPATAEESSARVQTARAANIRSKASQSSNVPRPVPSPGKTRAFRGNISLEGRLFANKPLYPDQEHHNGSIALAPEYYHEWPAGSSFIFAPFMRIDSADSERTHFDIRELNFLLFGDPWELRLGIGKVFWGVTEFVHLVDIINQTDLVENIKGEDKLGQPMAQLSIPGQWGVLDLFVLPYFRERTFPGADGRLRPALLVDTDHPVFESGDEERHVDFAIRYSQIFDFFDFGIYYFKGTSRDPLYIPAVNAGNEAVLLPYYRQIDQVGTDLQLVAGNWLWKLEALYQDNEDNPYFATTGGFEYTFVGLGSSKADLGIIMEYAYDDRDKEATTSFANDLFFGLRLGVNDAASTEILLGLGLDLDSRGQLFQIEASRRLANNVSLALEGWSFFNTDSGDYYLYSIREDAFVRLQIFYYF